MRTPLVIDDFQPLFSHYAPYDLLGDVCTLSFEPGMHGLVAPAPPPLEANSLSGQDQGRQAALTSEDRRGPLT